MPSALPRSYDRPGRQAAGSARQSGILGHARNGRAVRLPPDLFGLLQTHLLDSLAVATASAERAKWRTRIEVVRRRARGLGFQQVPVWYETSHSVTNQFEVAAQPLGLLKLLPHPTPFYDWIMGFHERWSNRAALRGAVLDGVRRVVEVGVGTGYLLGQLVQRTAEHQRVAAVDLSPRMLRNAANYLGRHHLLSPRVDFECGDCTRLPYADATFDLYVSSYLFDLLSEPELPAAIAEMARVLAPNGRAILVTMTTELEGVGRLRRVLGRLANGFYCLGYHSGRWNPIWRFLCGGYAPHCRPIALGRYLRESPSLVVDYTKVTHVSVFPVRVYYVRRREALAAQAPATRS